MLRCTISANTDASVLLHEMFPFVELIFTRRYTHSPPTLRQLSAWCVATAYPSSAGRVVAGKSVELYERYLHTVEVSREDPRRFTFIQTYTGSPLPRLFTTGEALEVLRAASAVVKRQINE